MAAFVVVAPTAPSPLRSSLRLDIFPGSAMPSVFPAGTPFWVGCAFVPDVDDPVTGKRTLDERTRFELAVDGASVAVHRDVAADDPAGGRLEAATFPHGLPVGWHRFAGRWYDRGRLVLTSDTSVEFVEP